MAEQEIELTFTWENGVAYEMAFKKNSDDKITIIKMQENGKIATLWPHVQAICEAFVKEKLNGIGFDMKA